MDEIKDKCTFLLSSYDGGEDCWEGFFMCLRDQWPQMDMPIVLNTESKTYSFPGYRITTYGLHCDKKYSWGKRLLDTLEKINTKYVLIFLEDFWLNKPVDDIFFRRTVKWMDENPDIASFSYYPCLPGTNIDDGLFERFELRPQKCEYRLNAQAAIWRRDRLIRFIRPHEDAWEWEIFGSERASRYPDRFYVLKEGSPLVFSYGNNLRGCIIHRGKWNKEEVMPLVEKYDLKIDFSVRGFEDWDRFREDINNTSILYRLKKPDKLGRIKRKIIKKVAIFKMKGAFDE